MFQKEAGRTGLSKRGWIGLAATLLSKLDQLSYFRPLGVICSPQGKPNLDARKPDALQRAIRYRLPTSLGKAA
jgi:hypothetical protein